ncbi:leukocyte receptor cluster member 1-like protein, partial [Trifolium medium]|nr:leukocyte receptor cluster member 1-like protein [Trifolium medium]
MKTKKLKLRKEPGESSIRAVGPEDEKYRLGYGIAGKGVQLPWKGEKRKKTLEELREERLKRERKEKEREMALRHPKQSRGEAFGSSRYYNR